MSEKKFVLTVTIKREDDNAMVYYKVSCKQTKLLNLVSKAYYL